MAGFPRAGSSLLANILAQNPLFHTTPTSGLIGSIINIRDNWKTNDIYKSNGEEYIFPKIKTMIKNMIIGFYEKEVLDGKIPIDKNRGWSGEIGMLEEAFNCNIKIIYPIRHIGDCVISMEKINRKNNFNNYGDNGNWINEQSTVGRIENFIKAEGVFGLPLLRLREIIYRNLIDRLVLVPYNDLLTYPNDIMNRIYDELELSRFNHDFNNIKQVIQEQDIHHGFSPHSLHKIKEGKLLNLNNRTYDVIDETNIIKLEQEIFGDITNFINKISIVKGII